ncbi:hypothetical protein [Mesorhizobium dulcispinae]|uniref:hypothetical protein n=1 Tax=Mesorhizobium dulcispinae TaxID=3072316 RepID=UPI002A23DE4E|nr:hypothetical protein [Mesorhizobium sp. VK23D]MDX8522251.1 hypothetical protein [Mesorhizobium sp. VK23D]
MLHAALIPSQVRPPRLSLFRRAHCPENPASAGFSVSPAQGGDPILLGILGGTRHSVGAYHQGVPGSAQKQGGGDLRSLFAFDAKPIKKRLQPSFCARSQP